MSSSGINNLRKTVTNRISPKKKQDELDFGQIEKIEGHYELNGQIYIRLAWSKHKANTLKEKPVVKFEKVEQFRPTLLTSYFRSLIQGNSL